MPKIKNLTQQQLANWKTVTDAIDSAADDDAAVQAVKEFSLSIIKAQAGNDHPAIAEMERPKAWAPAEVFLDVGKALGANVFVHSKAYSPSVIQPSPTNMDWHIEHVKMGEGPGNDPNHYQPQNGPKILGNGDCAWGTICHLIKANRVHVEQFKNGAVTTTAATSAAEITASRPPVTSTATSAAETTTRRPPVASTATPAAETTASRPPVTSTAKPTEQPTNKWEKIAQESVTEDEFKKSNALYEADEKFYRKNHKILSNFDLPTLRKIYSELTQKNTADNHYLRTNGTKLLNSSDALNNPNSLRQSLTHLMARHIQHYPQDSGVVDKHSSTSADSVGQATIEPTENSTLSPA